MKCIHKHFILFFFVFAACTKPSDILILEDGVYFDGDGFKEFKELVIQADSILEISNTQSEKDGLRISAKGKYVIPGLIDAHVHLIADPWEYKTDTINPLKSANVSLLSGVTTVIDLFFPEHYCREFKDSIKLKPHLFTSVILSGPMLTSEGGHGTQYDIDAQTITKSSDIPQIIDRIVSNGADLIKVVYSCSPGSSLTYNMLIRITNEAHKRGILVFAHINTVEEAMDCVSVGVDVLAHIPIGSLADSQLNVIKESGVFIIPTISAYQSFFEGHNVDYMSDSLLLKITPSLKIDSMKRLVPTKPLLSEDLISYFKPNYYKNLGKIIHKKIFVLAGSDAGNYGVYHGYSLYNELSIYVQSGMSNLDAVRTATINISRLMPNSKIGAVREGYYADLLLLENNPLLDIDNLKKQSLVIHRGKIITKQFY